MNLTAEQLRQLDQSVLSFIGDPPTTDVVAELIGLDARAAAPPLMNGYRWARWIVRHALMLPTPEKFVRIVETADAGRALVELHVIVAELQEDRREWTRGSDVLWVPEGWPFVDRQAMRDALTTMAGGDGPTALVIEGPFGHGKRTIGEYVRFLASETASFRAVVVELRREPAPGVLFSLVTDLRMALDQRGVVHSEHAEPERQAVVFARDVALAAQATDPPTWFVANIVDHEGLEEGVLAFINELLRLVQDVPAIGAKLRVLVLCDQLSLLEFDHPPPLDARHTLAQVSDVEVRQWLEAAAPGQPDDLYELTTESVISSLESVGPPISKRLRVLSRSLSVAYGQLVAGGT